MKTGSDRDLHQAGGDPSDTLVNSKWHYANPSGAKAKKITTRLLDSLCIEYRKVNGKNFWEANSENLPSIFAELQTEARGRMRDLHPDTGGNPNEFIAFVKDYNVAKLMFKRNGANNAPQRESSNVLFVPTGTIKKTKRTFEIMHLISQGLSNREIVREAKACHNTVKNVRHLMSDKAPLCGCGKPTTHKGWCDTRLARYPKRQHFISVGIANLPQNISGPPGCRGPKSETHKQRISDAMRGKPKSIEHAAFCRIANFGHKHSAATRKRIGDALRARHAMRIQPSQCFPVAPSPM